MVVVDANPTQSVRPGVRFRCGAAVRLPRPCVGRPACVPRRRGQTPEPCCCTRRRRLRQGEDSPLAWRWCEHDDLYPLGDGPFSSSSSSSAASSSLLRRAAWTTSRHPSGVGALCRPSAQKQTGCRRRVGRRPRRRTRTSRRDTRSGRQQGLVLVVSSSPRGGSRERASDRLGAT
jgi:hypothetical protein